MAMVSGCVSKAKASSDGGSTVGAVNGLPGDCVPPLRGSDEFGRVVKEPPVESSLTMPKVAISVISASSASVG